MIILGASGLIFGWLTYLLARGLWSRRPGQVAVAVLVLVFYGGLIFGVLPGQAGSELAGPPRRRGRRRARGLAAAPPQQPSAGGVPLVVVGLVDRSGRQLRLQPAHLVPRRGQPDLDR